MPLADWTGRTRGEGFLEQLEAAAEELGLDGGVVNGVGVYTASWRGGRYGLTVWLEDGAAVLRAFSNVRYPPAGPPEELARALMRWRASESWLSWDCHANDDWSAFFARCPIRLAAFTPRLLGCAIADALAEVAALDRKLVEAGYGRLAAPAAGRQPRLERPAPEQSIVQRVADAAARLLGGW